MIINIDNDINNNNTNTIIIIIIIIIIILLLLLIIIIVLRPCPPCHCRRPTRGQGPRVATPRARPSSGVINNNDTTTTTNNNKHDNNKGGYASGKALLGCARHRCRRNASART